MTTTDRPLVLAGEFPEPTADQWRALVRRVLLGDEDASPEEFDAAFEKRLVTRTLDGLEIQPLYTADDVAVGQIAPAERTRPTGSGWDVRVRIEVDGDGTDAGVRALDELSSGASSLLLGLRGAPAVDVDVLDRATTGVYLDLAAVVLDAGECSTDAAEALFALWERRGVPAAEARGVLGADPVGDHARTGGAADLDGALKGAVALAGRCTQAFPRALSDPGVRAMVVDATPYHEAGAGDAEELGLALATGVAYLRALTAGGLELDASLGQLEFRLAATADQFLTIAKFRAARQLWGRVADHCGAVAPTTRLHAVTSTAMTSRYDPWVNLMRTTVACFGAGVGGADAVTVQPHDTLRVPGGTDLARRLAHNVSAILAEEAHVARVADPAGGSFYVERLTGDLGAAAWEWFRDIERAGGIVAALEGGLVGTRLDATWAKRRQRLAVRRDPLTGVSEYPAVDDEPPPPAPPLLPSPLAPVPAGGAFPPLPVRRYAAPFEELRARSDGAAATGARPLIFLAALGSAAANTARVAFARNFFETAGIRAVASPVGASAGDLAGEFTRSGATLACLCSSDAVYADEAVPAAAALRAAGAIRLYLAGRPGEPNGALEAAGVDEFVFVGSDLLDVLGRALDAANVGGHPRTPGGDVGSSRPT